MLITEFYGNQEIFVTGGTGFLGKALIEKLLRDCRKIKTIYMLLRTKKSDNIRDRLEEFKKENVFDRIREECPEVLNKLYPIEGDSKELRLGIKDEDIELLRNVSIIFHMAANVKFNDALKSAVLLNVRGTYELVKIAEKLKNLTVFLHCSTAYSNPLSNTVEEKIYSTPVDWRKTIQIAETYDENTINALCKKYTGHFPNTYTFTKNITEHIINDYSSKLPMFLFRPAVVVSAAHEPFPGWTDNLNGVLGATIGSAVGVLPIMFCKPDVKLIYVPIDWVTKLTIVAAYKRGIQKLKNEIVDDGLEVVNCSSKEISKFTFRQNYDVVKSCIEKNPLENSFWRYGGTHLTSCFYFFYFYLCLINLPMSIVLDTVLRVMGKKPMGWKLTRHVLYFAQTVGFFTGKTFIMKNSNMLNLETSIPDSELETFGTLKEMQNIDHMKYAMDFITGAKVNIFKHPSVATNGARLRYKVLFVLNTAIKLIVYGLILRYLWFKLY